MVPFLQKTRGNNRAFVMFLLMPLFMETHRTGAALLVLSMAPLLILRKIFRGTTSLSLAFELFKIFLLVPFFRTLLVFLLMPLLMHILRKIFMGATSLCLASNSFPEPCGSTV